MMKLTELENMGLNQDLQSIADDVQLLENNSLSFIPTVKCQPVSYASEWWWLHLQNELISLAYHLLLAKRPFLLDWIAMIENTINNGKLQHKKYDLSF